MSKKTISFRRHSWELQSAMSQKFGKRDGSEIGFRLLMIRLLNFAWIGLGGVLLPLNR